ncbi:MAG: phosphoglucosamine mutase [Oligoflexia bacterium]|nr:phosphoglucosamine mutase [Oligoflexia bacterium]
MKKRKLFGTDGIRGLANKFPMNTEVAMHVGAATAKVLFKRAGGHKRTDYPKPRIIIGKDTRLSCYMLEQALTSGICSMGADVLLTGPIPTPAVAFLVKDMRADAGIMVSASHNQYQDNGIKIFDHEGFKLPDALEEEIEEMVWKALEGHLDDENLPKNDKIGRTVRIDDAPGRYIVGLKNSLPSGFHLQDIPLVLDCANGAAYKVAPTVFRELGAKVFLKGSEPNGTNINLGVGALYPEVAAGAVVEFSAKIGISLDGDSDRVILSDENGEVVNGDQVIGICAAELKRLGKLKGNTVVTTPMSNLGLEQFLESQGINLTRAGVGDRYVLEEMRTNGYSFGGEQSGHIIFGDYSSTGDGILAALKVIEIMTKTGRALSELKKQVTMFPQVREDVRIVERKEIKDLPEVKKLIEETEKELKGKGRIFVRYSGTEPLVRVMIEGPDVKVIRAMAKKIGAAFSKAIGE